VDLTRTVGWFTTIYPVAVQLTGRGVGEDLAAVKMQLRAVPTGGLGYGVLRYLDEAGQTALAAMPPADLLFNYLGQLDHVLSDDAWSAATEPKGSERSALQRRTHLLEVTAYISGHCLHLTWTYSREAHSDETIAALAAQCLDELRAVITQSCNMEGRYTPADFPLAALNVNELADLIADIENRID
jgi:non-ribosomal peptide synthase protein (TIGR01720 family)